jgi:hypothetical protein
MAASRRCQRGSGERREIGQWHNALARTWSGQEDRRGEQSDERGGPGSRVGSKMS